MSVPIMSALLPAPRAPMKAATGTGVVMMSTRPHLSDLQRNPQRMAAQAQELLRLDPTVRAAERAISNRLAALAWHLEDGDGATIGDGEEENADAAAMAVRSLLLNPYRPAPGDPRSTTPRTWAGLVGITSRHMGACGIAFWYLDQAEALAGTPLQLLYLNPARVTPEVDADGAVYDWTLDKDRPGGGVRLGLDRVIPFPLEEPDDGVFPAGLIETAFGKLEVGRLADRHVSMTLAAGGRLSGVLSPKEGYMEDEPYKQLVRDVRTIAEAPDAAKRMLILRGPIEHKDAAATLADLDLVRIATMTREDKLALWGVPHSIIGLPTPEGLGGGASKETDKAIFWENACDPRLSVIEQTVQQLLLDRYQEHGLRLDIVFERPSFDDETPAFERATKAAVLPLTNRERRELVGQDPFGDERDDEVWMASTMVRVSSEAEKPDPPAPPPFGAPPVPVPDMPPEAPIEPSAKARKPDDDAISAARRDVAAALAAIGKRTTERVQRHAEHLSRKPTDDSVWWDAEYAERTLEAALRPHVEAVARASSEWADGVVAGKASLDAILPRLLRSVGVRIKGIGETTRERVRRLVEQGIAQGMGAAELGDLIEREGPFGELRAETIARTETARVHNEAAVEAFGEAGVTHVIAVDGDDDEECSARDGRVFTVAEAASIADHPNGTLSWDPVVDTRVLGAA